MSEVRILYRPPYPSPLGAIIMYMKRFNQIFTLLLLPVDFLMVWGAFLVAYYIRADWTIAEATYIQPFADYATFTAELSLLWLVIFFVFGLYQFRGIKNTGELFAKVITGTSVALALFIIGLFLAKTQFFSRLIVVYFWGFSILMVPIGRGLISFFKQWLQYYGTGVERVWLIADGSIATALQNHILSQRPSQNLVGTSPSFDLEVLKQQPIDRVVIGSEPDQSTMLRLIRYCEDHGVTLQYIPSLTGLYTSHITIETVAGYPLIELAPTPLSGWGRIAKRACDIILSILGIIVLSPVMLIIAIAIKLNSRGPIIYSQKRVGEFGKLFTFYKFRSMYTEMSVGLGGEQADKMLEELRTRNEASGPLFKLKDDPRITKVGKFIRRTSLDELPQLFNILIGNMSAVGPRPALPHEVAQYEDATRRRLLIKPGVTGLWQVSGRSDASFNDYVQLDVYYLEHWSLWLDLKIILLTFRAVFARKGSY